MKHFVILLVLLSPLFAYSQTNYVNSFSSIPSYTDTEIQERLDNLRNAIVHPFLDNVVRSYVKTYTVLKRPRTEAMLGRASMYFPIFEKILQERNMPADLKYLSVLESALDPTATSRSGAKGLWQFMPPTGKEYGLAINRLVDERSDPHKSTHAAIDYLSRLHNKYGDWKLALAAYNGGPGRVNRAIKRARSKSFHRIAKYLPRETRNYIPAFVAAAYIMNYFQYHNLYPVQPDYDLRFTSTVKLYEQISFQKIAELTGLSIQMIETLNPSYKQNLIPPSVRGNYLILPEYTMASFLNYLGRPDAQYFPNVASSRISAPVQHQGILGNVSVSSDSRNYADHFRTTYVVQEGETLDFLASNFGCEKYEIMSWNNLSSMMLSKGQSIAIYLPKNNINRLDKFSKLDELTFETVEAQTNYLYLPKLAKYTLHKSRKGKGSRLKSRAKKNKEKTVFYQIRRRETLLDIAEKFPGVSVQDILEQNNITNEDTLTPGTLLKIQINNF